MENGDDRPGKASVGQPEGLLSCKPGSLVSTLGKASRQVTGQVTRLIVRTAPSALSGVDQIMTTCDTARRTETTTRTGVNFSVGCFNMVCYSYVRYFSEG